MSESALLPLDQPRSIPLTINGQVVTYHFDPIGEKDWMKYFSAIINQTIQSNGRREAIFDDSCAADYLVRSTTRTAEGYSGALTGRWRNNLPLAHVAAVAVVLTGVGVETASSDPSLADLIDVSLIATWSQGEAGKMMQYSGLIHHFNQPTAAQLKRFRMESSRTWITGSSKEPITHYAARQIVAAKLYDEMIVSVDGYSVHGQPLTDDVKDICRYMDALHKVVAVLQVFSPRGEDIMIGTDADQGDEAADAAEV